MVFIDILRGFRYACALIRKTYNNFGSKYFIDIILKVIPMASEKSVIKVSGKLFWYNL